MNKLFIIGNGFDLAHGLKTKYSDFLIWYLNDCLIKLVNRENYQDILINITRLGPPLRTYNTFDSTEKFLEYCFEYKVIKFECKYDLLKNILYKSIGQNWVDIEYEYYSVLVNKFKDLSKPGSDFFKIKHEVFNLNESLKYLKEKLEEYLSIIKNIQSVNEKILNHFTNEFETDKLYYEPKDILILNFNYTSSIDLYKTELEWYAKNIYAPNPSIPKAVFNLIDIHGSVNDNKNPIIFGYGDEMDPNYKGIEQLNDNEFIKHIKSFEYLKTNNYRKFTKFINAEPFNVYIMGHSCGISDRILLKNIFEHDHCQEIKIFYYDKDDFYNKIRNISRHFDSNAAARQKMRTRIVPFKESSPLVSIS